MVKSYSSQAKVSRNARLAMLRFYAQEGASDVVKQDRLFEACENHFREYSTKYVCSRDLQPYVAHLEPSRKELFLITSSSCAKSVSPKDNAPEVRASSMVTTLLLINAIGSSGFVDDFRNQRTEDGLLPCYLP